jgi:hypothetical protein
VSLDVVLTCLSTQRTITVENQADLLPSCRLVPFPTNHDSRSHSRRHDHDENRSSNRFMSVAEAMGRALQQTSISTNIKERLDFSCALMNADGSLISNAPNVPVHLGESRF